MAWNLLYRLQEEENCAAMEFAMGTESATATRATASRAHATAKRSVQTCAAPQRSSRERILASPGGTALPRSFTGIPSFSRQEQSSPVSAAHAGLRFPLQCKLAIGAVNDPLESEADAMADRIMRMPAPSISPAKNSPYTPPAVQRKCSECEEEEEKEKVQRKATAANPEIAAAPPIIHDVLSSPGQPLDLATRSFMESRFGQDFSGVRIHEDQKSAESACAVSAHAYASGNHVVFGAGQYRPHSSEGRRLIAHELSHVVQQQSGYPHMISRFKVEDCDAGNPMETSTSVKDAHTVAMRMLQSAITAVNTDPLPPAVIKAAAAHFKLALPPANPKDKKYWDKAKTALSTMTKADTKATYECEPKQNWWNGGCISGVDAVSLFNIHLCPLWWQSYSTPLDRGAILLHEWGHKWGKGVNRIFETYRFDKGYAGQSTEKRLEQPDSYMAFVYEMWTGSPPTF
jgi:hypothetical protein